MILTPPWGCGTLITSGTLIKDSRVFDFKYVVTGKACAVRPLERHDGVKVTIIIRNIYLRRWLESDSKRLYYLGGKELHDI